MYQENDKVLTESQILQDEMEIFDLNKNGTAEDDE